VCEQGQDHNGNEGLSGDTPTPLVRPFGDVEEHAVIRQIGTSDLYLGNELAADPTYHDREFGFVLSATEKPCPLTTHHHPLVDGSGNEWSDFRTAVDRCRTLYRQDGSVLVHCSAGISRSSTLLATTIAAEEQRTFREALEIVQKARPYAMPNPALHELAVVYLAANV
jgi:atypical dual specificity phosphatase